MFSLLYDAWLSWLPLLVKLQVQICFFFQNQVFRVVCKQKHYNIFCLILNSTKKQNTPLFYSVTQPCYRPDIKIRLFHNPTENSIPKLTLFSLLSKCSNRGIQTTLGEYKPHLSRDMFWSLCLFLHMKGNGYLLKCQSYEKWYQMDAIEPKVLCSRVSPEWNETNCNKKEWVLFLSEVKFLLILILCMAGNTTNLVFLLGIHLGGFPAGSCIIL